MRASRLSFPVLLALVACAASEAPAADPAPAAPALEPLWIAKGFEDPEGIARAPDGTYFVSNVKGEGTARDGNGYVSKLSPDGALVTQRFAAGLNGPKGMTVKDGVLYVADIDEVVMFDASTGARLQSIQVPDAGFLNDMTVWGEEVLVSDSGKAAILSIRDGAAEVWLSDTRLAGVNGLLGDGDRLLVLTMNSGSLFSVSAAGEMAEIAAGMADADGIGLVPGGGYLVSSWPGQIHYAGEDGAVTTLLDTTEAGTLQNDLTVFDDRVIVPNWAPGTVTAWKVVR